MNLLPFISFASTTVSQVFANRIESPNSSVPTDSHEGEGAESTDYGLYYVSGVNLLKFGPTPNLSGEYCFILVVQMFDAYDHKTLMILSLLTGVPNDSHSENNEGEVAMSTNYGSDYVSGGNLLKFCPTPANLSG